MHPKAKTKKIRKKCFFQCSIVVIVRPKRVADAKAHIDFWEKQLTRKQRYYIHYSLLVSCSPQKIGLCLTILAGKWAVTNNLAKNDNLIACKHWLIKS